MDYLGGTGTSRGPIPTFFAACVGGCRGVVPLPGIPSIVEHSVVFFTYSLFPITASLLLWGAASQTRPRYGAISWGATTRRAHSTAPLGCCRGGYHPPKSLPLGVWLSGGQSEDMTSSLTRGGICEANDG